MEVLTNAIWQEKKYELEGLEETKLLVFRDNIFIENLVQCRGKLLKLIEFSKFARYNKNLQKPIAFFYYRNNQLKKKKERNKIHSKLQLKHIVFRN